MLVAPMLLPRGAVLRRVQQYAVRQRTLTQKKARKAMTTDLACSITNIEFVSV